MQLNFWYHNLIGTFLYAILHLYYYNTFTHDCHAFNSATQADTK